MARPDPLRDFAITVGIALPGFLASSVVYLAVEPIAANRWRPVFEEAGYSLALVSIVAYLLAGLTIRSCSRDPDIAWGGGSIATLFSLGVLLPIWIGLGRAVVDQSSIFRIVLWCQPLVAIGGYLLGLLAAGVLRLIVGADRATG